MLDHDKLGRRLDRRMKKMDISLDDVIKKIGISSKSTLSRSKRGDTHLDADHFIALATWLGEPMESFLKSKDKYIVHYPNADTMTKIRATLSADPTLSLEAKEGLEDIISIAYENILR